MTPPAYRFETEAQRRALTETPVKRDIPIDPQTGVAVGRLWPEAPQAWTIGARGEPIVVDHTGTVWSGDFAGPSVGAVDRVIADKHRIRLLLDDVIAEVDADSLQRLREWPAENVADIASMGDGDLWWLRDRYVEAIDRCGDGRIIGEDERWAGGRIGAAGDAVAVVRPAQCWLVGQSSAPKDIAGARSVSSGDLLLVECGQPNPGFVALAPDGGEAVTGRWLGDAPASINGHGEALFGLFEQRDGWQLRRFDGVLRPLGSKHVTPWLETASLTSDWLRADVTVLLPEGATLTLRYVEDRSPVDAEEPVDLTYVGVWRADPAPETFILPLHAARTAALRVEIELAQAAADSAPRFDGLVVHYEAPSLMDHLPALYRAPSGDGDQTLRRLVAVVEATTQGIDGEIAGLAARLEPTRADDRSLPELAAMLGLPFDDSLTPAMQRAILDAAMPTLLGRGTRRGLEAMLRALFPGRPISVVDQRERMVPIVLGGADVPGDTLPALLSGPSRRDPRLNARLTLGRTALCSVAPSDARAVASPRVAVTIPATARERLRFAVAVRGMVEAMVPAGVRLQLRWAPWRDRDGAPPADTMSTIIDPVPLTLDDGPSIGRALLGGRREPWLDGSTTDGTQMI